MRHKQIQARELAPAQLRILLTMARELLQADEWQHSLGLVGRALVEMIAPRSGLLVVRGDRVDVAGFDRLGMPAPAGEDHALYPAAMALLSEVVHPRGRAAAGAAPHEQDGGRVLVVAVPAHGAIAALAVEWEHALSAAELDRRRQALSFILELTAAALGKIESRSALERRVSDQGRQLATTGERHAAELAKRDAAAAELRLLSLTDVLTGLYNRRGFFLHAERMFKVSQRQRAQSAVIFADIDGLKRVNDQLGHDAGDRLICDAATVFRQSFRQADVVARLGGDEFVAYTLDDEQPGLILDRLKANVHAFNLMNERPYNVSISAGLVQCDPGAGRTLSHYVLLADERMYKQKRRRPHSGARHGQQPF